MIVECYSADVYCDHPEHTYGDVGTMSEPATFTGASKRSTDRARRRAGWLRLKGKDYCHECAKRMRDGEPVAPVRQARLCPKCGQPGEMFTADLDWCPRCNHQWART